jgi:UDP-glucuronate decarboxylase
MLELAEKIISITGSKSIIVFEPLPEDDPRQRKPDISKAQDLLGWKPAVSLESGIKLTADYFMRELKS